MGMVPKRVVWIGSAERERETERHCQESSLWSSLVVQWVKNLGFCHCYGSCYCCGAGSGLIPGPELPHTIGLAKEKRKKIPLRFWAMDRKEGSEILAKKCHRLSPKQQQRCKRTLAKPFLYSRNHTSRQAFLCLSFCLVPTRALQVRYKLSPKTATTTGASMT